MSRTTPLYLIINTQLLPSLNPHTATRQQVCPHLGRAASHYPKAAQVSAPLLLVLLLVLFLLPSCLSATLFPVTLCPLRLLRLLPVPGICEDPRPTSFTALTTPALQEPCCAREECLLVALLSQGRMSASRPAVPGKNVC